MKCVVSWIPLRICVRSGNTQPHLKVMGTAVSAACRTPVEKPSTSEFVKGHNYVFVIRVNIISGVARQVLKVLCFLQDRLGGVLRQHWSLSFAGFC